METKDLLGRTIKVGDFIVYPTYLGSTTYMNFAEVLEISEVKQRWPTSATGPRSPRLSVRKRSRDHKGVERETKASVVCVERTVVVYDTSWEEYFSAHSTTG